MTLFHGAFWRVSGYASALALATFSSAGASIGAPLPEATFWVQSGPEADALTKAAAEYVSKTGNPVRIEPQGRAGWRAKYETALAAGSKAVDGVLHISQQVPTLAAAGLLLPVEPGLLNSADYNVNDIPNSVQNEMKMGDRWFMLPTDITLETYVYRTDLISSPPATWNELREIARRFTQSANSSSPTRYGYAYSAGPGNIIPSWRGVMGSFGAQLIDDKGCVRADSPQALESWKFYIGLKNEDKVTPPDINNWDYPEILVGLQTGTLAQASFFSSGMATLTDCAQSPNVCKFIALRAQPAGPQGSKTRINPLGIMVNASTDRKESVFAFLKWVTGPEGGKVYTQAGGTNPRVSILNDESFRASRPWYPAMITAMENGMPSIRHPRAREISETFDRYAQQAVAGSIKAEDALKQASIETRRLLGNEANCK
jgi:multiple sugar transport system substrate-binding protein